MTHCDINKKRHFTEIFRKSYESYARAVVDVTPSPYDTEALPIQAGDLIGVIHKVNTVKMEVLSVNLIAFIKVPFENLFSCSTPLAPGWVNARAGLGDSSSST